MKTAAIIVTILAIGLACCQYKEPGIDRCIYEVINTLPKLKRYYWPRFNRVDPLKPDYTEIVNLKENMKNDAINLLGVVSCKRDAEPGETEPLYFKSLITYRTKGIDKARAECLETLLAASVAFLKLTNLNTVVFINRTLNHAFHQSNLANACAKGIAPGNFTIDMFKEYMDNNNPQ